jgi:hypothetical protein
MRKGVNRNPSRRPWSDDKTTRLDQSEMHKFCNLRVDGSISTAVLQVEDAQDAADAVQGDD